MRRSIASSAAIVEYKSHRGAAMARKALVAAAAAAWGCGARPAVDWSLPQSPQLLKQYREVTPNNYDTLNKCRRKFNIHTPLEPRISDFKSEKESFGFVCTFIR